MSIGSGRSLGLFHLPCCDLGSRSRKARPAAALGSVKGRGTTGEGASSEAAMAVPERRALPALGGAGTELDGADRVGIPVCTSPAGPSWETRSGTLSAAGLAGRSLRYRNSVTGARVRGCALRLAASPITDRLPCGCRIADADPLRTSRSRSARAPAPEPAPASPDAAAAVPSACRRRLPPKLAAPPSGMARRDRPIGSEVHFALG